MKSNVSDRDQRYSQNGKTPGEGLEKKNRMKGKESQQAQDWLPSQDLAKRPHRTPRPQDHQYFTLNGSYNPGRGMCFNRDLQPNLGSLI